MTPREASTVEPSSNTILGVAASSSPKKQQQQQRGKSSKPEKKRFVGVRQRPSGRWVAEIKDSTQKLRLWLGTFDNAEDAARAYDDAARALRGANTRTNFKTPANGSARLTRTTRELLRKVAMRSPQDLDTLNEKSPIIVPASKSNTSSSSQLQPDPCKPLPSYAPAAAPSIGFQHPVAHQLPSSTSSKSVYGAFIEKLTSRPKGLREDFSACASKQPALGNNNVDYSKISQQQSACIGFQETGDAMRTAGMLIDRESLEKPSQAEMSEQHPPLPEDDFLKPYSASCYYMSSKVRVSPSERYKVAPSIHAGSSSPSTTSSAYAMETSECEALIAGPSICGSESPIILSSTDHNGYSIGTSKSSTVEPSSPSSAAGAAPAAAAAAAGTADPNDNPESLWTWFEQALCAVS